MAPQLGVDFMILIVLYHILRQDLLVDLELVASTNLAGE